MPPRRRRVAAFVRARARTNAPPPQLGGMSGAETAVNNSLGSAKSDISCAGPTSQPLSPEETSVVTQGEGPGPHPLVPSQNGTRLRRSMLTRPINKRRHRLAQKHGRQPQQEPQMNTHMAEAASHYNKDLMVSEETMRPLIEDSAPQQQREQQFSTDRVKNSAAHPMRRVMKGLRTVAEIRKMQREKEQNLPQAKGNSSPSGIPVQGLCKGETDANGTPFEAATHTAARPLAAELCQPNLDRPEGRVTGKVLVQPGAVISRAIKRPDRKSAWKELPPNGGIGRSNSDPILGDSKAAATDTRLECADVQGVHMHMSSNSKQAQCSNKRVSSMIIAKARRINAVRRKVGSKKKIISPQIISKEKAGDYNKVKNGAIVEPEAAHKTGGVEPTCMQQKENAGKGVEVLREEDAAETRKQAEQEAARRKIEAARKKEEEAAVRKQAEQEAVRKRAEEEAARRKIEEARRKIEATRKKAEEEAARKKEEEQEAVRKRAEEEEARRKIEEVRRKEEEAARRKIEEARRKIEATRKKEEEAAVRKQAEQEAARKKAEETSASGGEVDAERMRAEVAEQRKRIEAERRKAKQELALRRAEAARARSDEVVARKGIEAVHKKGESVTEARKQAEQEAVHKKAEEEAARRKIEEARRKIEATRKKAEEEAARKKEEEQEAVRKRAEEEEARRKIEEVRRKEEEAARRKIEETRRKRAAAKRRAGRGKKESRAGKRGDTQED
ncbi:hypothetical protein ERJ75_000352500 [Trypanosoma vivax]|nr:hypothetical protein ERJ75_000352500 [Trypanosoma vivax]